MMIETADVLEWANAYEGELFHALLCDPPYHLTSITKRFSSPESAPAKKGVYARSSKGFMGKDWDGGDIAFRAETWAAFLPLLYPGAFCMAFAGSRGWHRMAVAIEDAGFLIHPTIFCWAYASGFPKARRIDTQIDNAAGAKTWVGHRYGAQALKPAVEPIIVFQKPYQGRPVDCITQTGAGALNIDGSRIGQDKVQAKVGNKFSGIYGNYSECPQSERTGRWASNLVMDADCAERLNASDEFFFTFDTVLEDADPLIYCPKAGRAEREAGLSCAPAYVGRTGGTSYQEIYCRNPHPAVKPLKLTQHLATLLLPPAEYAPRRLFVPFAGSGSEVCGAHIAGWEQAIGVERDPEYADIARARLKFWQGHSGLFESLTAQTEEAQLGFNMEFPI